MVAGELHDRYRCRVVGIDQSADMLRGARDRNGTFAGLVRGRAERLPFRDASFDHVTFTYLLRYVDDPAATLRELARVLRPGGRLATLEFGVPSGIAYPFWWLYTRAGLPLVGPGLLAFVAVGAALIVGYAFEAPLVHSDIGFALAWGAFPTLTLAWATGAAPLPAAAVAAGTAFLSLAQRRLSTRVRQIRRRGLTVTGTVEYKDGSRETIDARSLIGAPEAGLRLLWPAVALLALGVLLARWLS